MKLSEITSGKVSIPNDPTNEARALLLLQSAGLLSLKDGGSSMSTPADIDASKSKVSVSTLGFSGAGKSTLVRLVNGLETPTSGHVESDGTDLASRSAKRVRELRGRIGMVFQQFNLLRSRNVYANVAYPLEVAGGNKERQQARITELLQPARPCSRRAAQHDTAWWHPRQPCGKRCVERARQHHPAHPVHHFRCGPRALDAEGHRFDHRCEVDDISPDDRRDVRHKAASPSRTS